MRRKSAVAQGVFVAVLAASLAAAMFHGMKNPSAGNEASGPGAARIQQAWAKEAGGYDGMRKELLEKLAGGSLTPVVDGKALEGKWAVRSVRDGKPAEWVREYRPDGRLIVTHLGAGGAREEAKWQMLPGGAVMELFAASGADEDDADADAELMRVYRRSGEELIESTEDAGEVYALTRVRE